MLRVKDIMTSDVVTVTPEMSLRDAMELLSSPHISGAPVVVGAKVVGVVSASDLITLASAIPGGRRPAVVRSFRSGSRRRMVRSGTHSRRTPWMKR